MILRSSADPARAPVPDVEDFVEWDVANWSVALDFWTGHSRLDLSRVRALELGSRHGGLSLWLALQGARVVCSDVTEPSPLARRRHKDAGVADRICYEQIDASRIPGQESYDLILFKSMLGALGRGGRSDRQAEAIRSMHAALRPGGELFFAENLIGSPLHRFLRRRFISWHDRWRYVTIDEMLEFLCPFAAVTHRTVGFAGALGRSRMPQRVLGRLDRAVLDGMVPDHWRYIIIGVARK